MCTRNFLFLLGMVTFCSALSFAKPSDDVLDSVIQDNFLSEFTSHVWTASDGLPGNTITSVMQDKAGYLYIGTYDGLVRFDGMEFLTINNSYNPKYKFFSARSIFQDSRENIWLGSNDEGVACIQPDGDVRMFTTSEGMPNNSVRAITEDKEGNIWCGTAGGIAYITPQMEVVHPEGLDDYGDDSILVSCLYCDTAGRIWCASRKTNSVYYYTNQRFERYAGIRDMENLTVTYIAQDASGAFLFGVAPHFVIQVSGNDQKVYDVGYGKQPGTIINAIYIDSQNNTWIARDTGLTVMHNGQLSFYDQSLGLADNNVNDIIEDREGSIWLATDRGGVEKLSISKFKTVSMPTTVNSIVYDKTHGLVWLGGDNGLYCYNYSTLSFEENTITRYCANVRIRHVALARNGDLLVSCYNKLGQAQLSYDGTVKSWTVADGLVGDRVRVALEISNGDLYVGTTTGLSIIDHESGELYNLSQNNGLPHDFIMCLYEDRDGNIWCGTDGGGIFLLKDRQVVRTYTTTDGLAGNVIFKISQIKGDDLWICTGTGVNRFRDGRFTTLDASKGLGTNSVFQLIPDYTDTVWFTGNKGIASMRLSQMEAVANGIADSVEAKFFGQSDGLRSGGVTATSLSMTDDLGRIWFTLIDGFAIYDPVRVTGKTVPVVQLQEISVDNGTVPYTGQEIVIPPRGRRLRIKYTGLSFVSPEQMRFSYKLNGFDTDYSPWTTERAAAYTNLRPGRYDFYVRVRNADDTIGDLQIPLRVIKQPHLWQLWWFWALIALAVLSCVTAVIHLRFRQMRRYQEQLEREVARQTQELRTKNEMLQQRSQELKRANDKSQQLLLNILPKKIADELTEHPDDIIAKQYPNACVLFADIVGFTKLSDGRSASEIVRMLNILFSKFDTRVGLAGVEKIKTIGDAYMAACGLTEDAANDSAHQMIEFARGMFQDLQDFNKTSSVQLRMRIGINNGDLIAGVIGKTKFIYDIWGDTVNVASRMESTGRPNYIHVSEVTYRLTKDLYDYGEPEEIEVKGKGLMKTHFITLQEAAQ